MHILVLLFTSLFAGAEDFNVSRTPNGRLFLEGSCGMVETEANAMRAWGESVRGGTCNKPSTGSGMEGICAVDITDCMPEHVQKYHGMSAAQGGPNCWNFALVLKVLVPTLRESSQEEFEFYVSSPLCQPVPDGEKPQPGDIGSIEVRLPHRRQHVHGFIHISDNMVFNKRGILVQSGYALDSYEDMHKTYPNGEMPNGECSSDCGERPLSRFYPVSVRDSIPSALQDASICEFADRFDQAVIDACSSRAASIESNREACAKYCNATSLHYYRCLSWAQYLADVQGEGREAYDHMDELLRGAECTVEGATFETGALNPAQTRSVEDVVEALAVYAEQELARTNLGEKERLAIAGLVLRLDGMGDQTNAQGNRLATLIEQAKDQLKNYSGGTAQ